MFTKEAPDSAAGELIGVSEVAGLAGVGRAAVANWRKRHDDFPRPKAEPKAPTVKAQKKPEKTKSKDDKAKDEKRPAAKKADAKSKKERS